MKRMCVKRFFAMMLSLIMIMSGVSAVQPEEPAKAVADKSGHTKKAEFVNGEAIISLQLKKGEDSELIHEGALPSDRTVSVKRVMDFGYAEHVMVKPAKDGNVLLCGFYKEGLDELSTETGVFVYTFSPNTQEFTSEFHQEFGHDYARLRRQLLQHQVYAPSRLRRG